MRDATIEELIAELKKLEPLALGDLVPNRHSRQQLVDGVLPPPDETNTREFGQLVDRLIQIYINLDTLLANKINTLKRKIAALTAKNAGDPEIAKLVTERVDLQELQMSLPSPPPGYE